MALGTPSTTSPEPGWRNTPPLIQWGVATGVNPFTIRFSYDTGQAWSGTTTILGLNQRSYQVSQGGWDNVQPGKGLLAQLGGYASAGTGETTQPVLIGPWYRNAPPLSPVLVSTHGGVGVNGLWFFVYCYPDPNNHEQTLQMRINDDATWRNVPNAISFLQGRTFAFRVTTDTQYEFRLIDIMGLTGPSIVLTFTITPHQYTDTPLIPWTTPVKAIHINEIRTRLEGVAAMYGLTAPVWAEQVIAHTTSYRNFAKHVQEIRDAITAVANWLNTRGAGMVVPPQIWVGIPNGQPSAAVVMQLRNAIEAL